MELPPLPLPCPPPAAPCRCLACCCHARHALFCCACQAGGLFEAGEMDGCADTPDQLTALLQRMRGLRCIAAAAGRGRAGWLAAAAECRRWRRLLLLHAAAVLCQPSRVAQRLQLQGCMHQPVVGFAAGQPQAAASQLVCPLLASPLLPAPCHCPCCCSCRWQPAAAERLSCQPTLRLASSSSSSRRHWHAHAGSAGAKRRCRRRLFQLGARLAHQGNSWQCGWRPDGPRRTGGGPWQWPDEPPRRQRRCAAAAAAGRGGTATPPAGRARGVRLGRQPREAYAG